MTQRERQTPDSPAPVLPRHADCPPEKEEMSHWEDLFPRLPLVRQRELLEIAGRQGVLYDQQLKDLSPELAGKSAPPAIAPFPDFARRDLLRSFLKGAVAGLEPLKPVTIEPFDTELDADQRRAVAGALATPDVFLIEGRHGSGKSRVVAEVIAQFAAAGKRVLLLASTSAALDRVLEMIGSRDYVCSMRCVSPADAIESLPPCVRRLTLSERVRSFREQSEAASRRVAQALQQHAEKKCLAETLRAQLLGDLPRNPKGRGRGSRALQSPCDPSVRSDGRSWPPIRFAVRARVGYHRAANRGCSYAPRSCSQSDQGPAGGGPVSACPSARGTSTLAVAG